MVRFFFVTFLFFGFSKGAGRRCCLRSASLFQSLPIRFPKLWHNPAIALLVLFQFSAVPPAFGFFDVVAGPVTYFLSNFDGAHTTGTPFELPEA